MHASPPFLNQSTASQFREMCWDCGSTRSILVVEHDAETINFGGVW